MCGCRRHAIALDCERSHHRAPAAAHFGMSPSEALGARIAKLARDIADAPRLARTIPELAEGKP